MSYLITTDVSCEDCPQWTEGVAGEQVMRRDASAAAREAGWLVRGSRHWCPACRKKREARSKAREGTDG